MKTQKDNLFILELIIFCCYRWATFPVHSSEQDIEALQNQARRLVDKKNIIYVQFEARKNNTVL